MEALLVVGCVISGLGFLGLLIGIFFDFSGKHTLKQPNCADNMLGGLLAALFGRLMIWGSCFLIVIGAILCAVKWVGSH